MTWDIYLVSGPWIGTIRANTIEEALELAYKTWGRYLEGELRAVLPTSKGLRPVDFPDESKRN